MVCKSCNTILNDYESVRKYPGTTEYIDMCSHCYNASKVDSYLTDNQDVQEYVNKEDE